MNQHVPPILWICLAHRQLDEPPDSALSQDPQQRPDRPRQRPRCTRRPSGPRHPHCLIHLFR